MAQKVKLKDYIDVIIPRGGESLIRTVYENSQIPVIAHYKASYDNARRFLNEVDSSVVLVNASTRFNDGNQLGLGAEIGISTSKLHAFGPMGLEELTTCKFIVYGNGQIRD